MQFLPSRSQFQKNSASAALLTCLLANEEQFGLSDAILYYSFPLYRDENRIHGKDASITFIRNLLISSRQLEQEAEDAKQQNRNHRRKSLGQRELGDLFKFGKELPNALRHKIGEMAGQENPYGRFF